MISFVSAAMEIVRVFPSVRYKFMNEMFWCWVMQFARFINVLHTAVSCCALIARWLWDCVHVECQFLNEIYDCSLPWVLFNSKALSQRCAAGEEKGWEKLFEKIVFELQKVSRTPTHKFSAWNMWNFFLLSWVLCSWLVSAFKESEMSFSRSF